MSDIQILLIVVIAVLTTLLVVVGVQVVLVIIGIRGLIKRIHAILDGRETLENVVIPDRIKKVLAFLRTKLPWIRKILQR